MGARDLATRLVWGDPAPERRMTLTQWMDRLSAFGGPQGVYRSPGSYTYDASQAHSAVFACTDLLCRLIAWQMPIYVDGQPVGPVNRQGLLSITENPHPEPHMLRPHWEAQVLESAILRGYACGVVTSMSERGYPRQILPTHPDLLGWSDAGGRWDWTIDGRAARLWQEGGDLWVVPALRVPPGQPVGRGVLWHAMRQVQLGLSAGKFGTDFFEAGGLPVAHLKVAEPTMTDDEAAHVKAKYMGATTNRQPFVTTDAITLDTVPINAEESQFLATMAANKADVCSFFGVPPEAIGASSGDSMTYANVEGRNLLLLTNTVGAWMQWLEHMWSSLLPGRHTVSLDPEALLRTSTSALFSTAQTGLQSGVLTRDEARVMVGYEPLGGGEGGLSVPELTKALQQIYLSVGSVVTTDEAREILNRAGAGLPTPSKIDGGVPNA